MALNPEQETAAGHTVSPCLITAVPGSGKTRVIVERAVRLVKSGINPKSIMCITFTNKAADSMVKRLSDALGEDVAKKMWISTYHRLCLSILRKHGVNIGYAPNMTICMPDDQVDMIAQIARGKEIEITKPMVKKIAWAVNDSRENLESESEMEDKLDAIDPQFSDIGKEYLSKLKLCNQIDFTGMLSETVKLFKSSPAVLQKFTDYFSYLMVDEFQDSNFSQFSIVEMLMGEKKNIFAVFDIDQSIYGWRGAKPAHIKEFSRKHNARIIKLGENYRSTPQILEVADKLIRYNSDRMPADLRTSNPSGAPVICKQFETSDHEAKWIAESIRSLVKNGTYQKKDIAILYRINSMSRAIEMALRQTGLEYTLVGDFSFFDRREVKDCLAMLKFFANKKDSISFHRIVNKPKRQVGNVLFGKLENYAKYNEDGNIFEACTHIERIIKSEDARDGILEVVKAFESVSLSATPAEALTQLVTALRYEEYIKDEAENTDEINTRKANIEELINDSAKFTADGKGGIIEYLESTCLMSDSKEDTETDVVILSSVHSAKGLEWPCVFVCGVEDGIMPHNKAVDESDDGLDAERCVMYVAATRAKSLLSLTHTRRRAKSAFNAGGKMSYQLAKPSQFLYEMELLKLSKKDHKN